MARAATWEIGACLQERYELRGHLGRGGFGEVYSAFDRATGRDVAIKALLRPGAGAARFPREVRALALLGFPGVVRSLGEGVHDGIPFLVMEKVAGTPFPGRPIPCAWRDLEPIAIALLESLSRLHALGLIHRDLKPGNVHVDEHGVPTILDLGLAWGPDLGARLTGERHWLGTPHYLAPEQWGSQPIDARADLHSVGVMLYEALRGRLPFDGRSFPEILLEKSRNAPVPLARGAPDLPDRIADAIGRLLDPEPQRRPDSAEELLRVLRGAADPAGPRPLPWLGDRAPLDAVRAAIESGRSLDIAGGAGSGKSRLLDEAVRIARELGRELRFAVPAQSPLASLELLAGGKGGPEEGFEERSATLRAALEELFGRGGVLVADDFARIDRRSAAIIEGAREKGCVLRTTTDPASAGLRIPPLAEADLGELFHGPDRIHHLQQDGARELHRRTAGIPRLVAEELGAWERAGLCRRDGDRFRIRRSMLDRLEAGFELSAGLRVGIPREPLTRAAQDLLACVEISYPHATPLLLSRLSRRPLWEIEGSLEDLAAQHAVRPLGDGSWASVLTGQPGRVWTAEELRRVHAELALLLPAGEKSRLYHLIASYDGERASSDAVAREALEQARRFEESGRILPAVAALERSLEVVREHGGGSGGIELLRQWAALACSLGAGGVREALAAARAATPTAEIGTLARFLERFLESLESGGRSAVEALRDVAPLADPRLEALRRVGMFRAARAIPAADGDALLEEILAEISESGVHELQPAILDCRGQFLYRRGRYRESAEWHAKAAELSRSRPRLSSLINACIAWIEAGELDRAERAREEALELALAIRHPGHELWAIHLGRVIAHRTRSDPAPDRELCALAEGLASASLRGAIALTESAIARRSGDRSSARELAAGAESAFAAAGLEGSRAFAVVLSESLVDTPDPDRVLSAWRALEEEDIPGLCLQGLALGGESCGGSSDDRRRAALGYARRLEGYPFDAPREVLSIRECLDRLAPGGSSELLG